MFCEVSTVTSPSLWYMIVCPVCQQQWSVTAHKLVQCHSHTSIHRHFYLTRIVQFWNYLPVIDISLPPEIIKNQVVNYFWYQFLANFNSNFPCTFHLLCPCYRCSSLPTRRNFNSLINLISQSPMIQNYCFKEWNNILIWGYIAIFTTAIQYTIWPIENTDIHIACCNILLYFM